MENLILVNTNDNEIGTEEKLKCHMGKGKLHRSLSIFVFNKKGELLLQRRSKEKRLWPLYWSNTCCTHPRNGEMVEKAAHRRLEEEMGFDCDLKEIFAFEYHAVYENVGSENEIDRVFLGQHDGRVFPNPKEVAEWKFVDIKKLKSDVKKNPQNYTPWFKIALDGVIKNYLGLSQP